MIQFAAYDQLMEFAFECGIEQREIDRIIEGEALKFKIRVVGESWGKQVDYRGAHFVIKTQDAVDTIYKTIYKIEIYHRLLELMVKVDIEEGSSWFHFDLNDALRVITAGMSGKEKLFLGIILALVLGGAYTSGNVFSYLAQKEANAVSIEAIQALKEVALEHEETIRKMEDPARALINSMSEDDLIQTPATGELVSKDVIKNLYPRRPRTQPEVHNIDGQFWIKEIKFLENRMMVILEQNGFSFKTYTEMLDPESYREFFNQIQQRSDEQGLPFQMDLQVSIKHTPKKIMYGSIMGVGFPRPDRNIYAIKDLLDLDQ